MELSLAPTLTAGYAIAEKALRRWAAERLRCDARADGRTVYRFDLAGSTCTNRLIDVVMTVVVGGDGRIESARAEPAPGDSGCGAMCAAGGYDGSFLADACGCEEVIGLTLEEAAFRDWQVEPSGCFCTPGNRRHKWRNVLQAVHYAVTRPGT